MFGKFPSSICSTDHQPTEGSASDSQGLLENKNYSFTTFTPLRLSELTLLCFCSSQEANFHLACFTKVCMFRLLNSSSKPSSIYGPRFRGIFKTPLSSYLPLPSFPHLPLPSPPGTQALFSLSLHM